jgi:secondary thiamine-phosphate synthase enzyme
MPQTLAIATSGRGFTDITAAVGRLAAMAGVESGAAHLFAPHTSASLLIQENADPDVQRDLLAYFDRLVPEGAGYAHDAEGPDDMPAHIKSALTATSLTIPIAEGRLMLGLWQGVYLFEHRRAPQRRRVIVAFSRET